MGNGMGAPCYAILIDAGFARYGLKRKKDDPPHSAPEIEELIAAVAKQDCVKGMRLHRVYYYDAKPLTKSVTRPDGKVFDFSTSEMARQSHQQHAAIAKVPYVAMRFGELSDRGWRLKKRLLRGKKVFKEITPDDLEPNVQQKGVDMRIGLDIAALALKRQAQVIVLVTGDSDLIPAMKFARREGLQLVLVTLGQNVKDPMIDHADVVLDAKAAIFLQ